MFRVGLNPYGLAYTVGLQAYGTPPANPEGIGLGGFIDLAHGVGAQCIELDWRWLTPMSDTELARVRDLMRGAIPICSHWLTQTEGETLADAIRCARAVGATIVRLHLTPVVEGARASCGARWNDLVAHARRTIVREAPKAASAGLTLAIENHQDFGSEELIDLAEEAGDNVGLTLDTGNPFAVGEDPVEFTRRAARRIRHVHLKDYIAQFTTEGYRLVRCAVGDGSVPFQEIAAVLEPHLPALTASLELGALDARHIRLFTPEWWHGYRPRDARELAAALGRLRQRCMDERADCRTPWERLAPPRAIIDYEMAQLGRSVEYLRSIGWML